MYDSIYLPFPYYINLSFPFPYSHIHIHPSISTDPTVTDYNPNSNNIAPSRRGQNIQI